MDLSEDVKQEKEVPEKKVSTFTYISTKSGTSITNGTLSIILWFAISPSKHFQQL